MTALLLAGCLLSASGGEPDPIESALAKPVTQGFSSQALPAALASLSRSHGVALVADLPELSRAVLRPAEVKVAIHGNAASLAAALDGMLRPHKLTWLARHGVILVTTDAAAQSKYLDTRVYRLTRPIPAQRRVNAITSIVAPETWSNVGGPGDAVALPPDRIVVRQSPPVHRQILAKFGGTLALARGGTALDPKQASKIERKLAATATFDFDFDNATLSDAIAQLARTADLTMSVDRPSLKAAGIAENVRVTLRIGKPHSLAAGLSLLLEQADAQLTWTTSDTGIAITTVKSAQAKLVRRVYAVPDILPEGGAETLILAIHDCIAPSEWDDVGGEATIKPGDKEGTIEVRHSEPTHRQIAQLLADARAAKK